MVRPVRLSGHPAPMEDALPVVLVLGNFAHEGLTAKVESLGLRVVNKQLRSSPRNWQKIADFVEELVNGTRLPLTFAYISTPLLLDMAEPAYDEVRPQLIAQLQRTRTLLFVYEANLQGVVDPFPWDVEDQTSERARVEVRHGEATWDEAEQRRPSYESESREAWS